MLRRFLLIALLATANVTAADQQPGRLAFSATLESIKINARPDDVVTRQFRLTLEPNQPRTTFRVHVDDWWRTPDGAQSVNAAPGTLRHSCATWTSVNPVDATVSAGETMVVRVSVKVPHEITPSGFWCALTVDEVPDPMAQNAGVGVKFLASVSTGIFVYVGDVSRKASIVDLSADASNVRVRVRNDGNAPLGIDGRIEFYAAGTTVPAATVTLPRATVLTEPTVEGVMTAPLPSSIKLPSGRYRMRAILDFGTDHYIGAEREAVITRPVASAGRDR